jgi:hypothetical protein
MRVRWALNQLLFCLELGIAWLGLVFSLQGQVTKPSPLELEQSQFRLRHTRLIQWLCLLVAFNL